MTPLKHCYAQLGPEASAASQSRAVQTPVWIWNPWGPCYSAGSDSGDLCGAWESVLTSFPVGRWGQGCQSSDHSLNHQVPKHLIHMHVTVSEPYSRVKACRIPIWTELRFFFSEAKTKLRKGYCMWIPDGLYLMWSTQQPPLPQAWVTVEDPYSPFQVTLAGRSLCSQKE